MCISSVPRHIIFILKLQLIKDKEKILKESREWKTYIQRNKGYIKYLSRDITNKERVQLNI